MIKHRFLPFLCQILQPPFRVSNWRSFISNLRPEEQRQERHSELLLLVRFPGARQGKCIPYIGTCTCTCMIVYNYTVHVKLIHCSRRRGFNRAPSAATKKYCLKHNGHYRQVFQNAVRSNLIVQFYNVLSLVQNRHIH